MWPRRRPRTAKPSPRPLFVPLLRGPERLEDRTAPANLKMTSAFLVDASDTPQANPVYGQMIYIQANWNSAAMTGSEPAVPVRYTANFPANYFYAGSPAASFPGDSGTVYHGSGGGSWYWWRGGWYAGTAAFTVTAMIDPNNQIAETNEADNSVTFTVTPTAPADLPQKFLQPIGLTPNGDWAITNYADIDPTGSLSDYRRGGYAYNGHDAIDAGPVNFARQDSGTPLTAVADGVIDQIDGGNNFDRETSWNGGQYWNAVWVNHGNGYRTVYGHMAAGSQTVKVGDPVKAGQLLGLMGSSGISTGTHVHYTLYYRGCPVEAGFSPSSYWLSPLSYAGSAPSFYFDAGVTNYDPSNPVWDFSEYPSQFKDFGTSGANQQIRFYVQPYNIKTTDVMYFRWIRPNGTIEQTSNFSPNGNYTYSVWWWQRPNDPFLASPGTWQVVYYLNGTTAAHEQKRVSFTVTSGSGSPSLLVRDPNNGNQIVVDNRTTPFDLGTVAQGGTAPTKSFSLQNHGTGTLSLTNYQLPPGFSLVSGPSSIAVNSSATLTVRLDTAVVGAKYGSLKVDTNDPDVGTFEFTLSGTVTGTPPTGSPVIGVSGNAAATYNFQAVPKVISPAATVTDSNSSNFNGGTLTVQYAAFGAAEDRLAVRNQGTAAGQIGVSGSTVTYAGTAIGTFAGGTGLTPLVFTLNANATVAATQALLRNLTYQNVSATPMTQRKAVRYTLTDGTGNTSNLAIQHVINSGVARNPTVAALPDRTVTRGATLTQAGSFTDPYGTSWTATVDYGDGTGVQPLALTGTTYTLSHAYTVAAGNYTATVTVTNNEGGTHTRAMAVTVANPVGVASVVVNDNAGPQRSRVTSATVTFTGLVTLPGTPSNAFTLTGPNGTVSVSVNTAGSTGTQTVARLTFVGAGTEFGSVADGQYTLTTLAGQVTDANGGQLDGDGNGLAGGDKSDQFFRLFGDGNGDASTDGTDFLEFANTYQVSAPDIGFKGYYDYNQDATVDGTDFLEFANRFGVTL